MSYNIKVKDFGNGTYEVSNYSKEVRTKEYDVDDDEIKINVNMLDNPMYVDSIKMKYPEQWEKFLKKLQIENKVYDYNPFTEKMEVMSTELVSERVPDKARSMAVSMGRSKQAVYDCARANKWDYFLTFTLNKAKVDRYDFVKCKKKLQYWLDNFKRRKCPTLEYLVVPEQHEDGAWHFHALCFGLCNDLLVDSGHLDKRGNTVYNLPGYTLGWFTAELVGDTHRISTYITKYIEKTVYSIPSGKRYFVSRGVLKPDVKTFTLTEEEKQQLYDSLGVCTYEKEVVGPEFKVNYMHFNT